MFLKDTMNAGLQSCLPGGHALPALEAAMGDRGCHLKSSIDLPESHGKSHKLPHLWLFNLKLMTH